jgi:hypothetical protein
MPVKEGPLNYDAFLSYARDDDEPFVKRLYEDLSRRKFRIWWDREDMPNRALTFLQEIRDRIDDCNRLLAVVGPAALKSEYVLAEWAHARLFSKGLVPILRLSNYEEIPMGYRKFHAPDFRDDSRYESALGELVRVLDEKVVELGPLRTTVPALPAYFHTRTEALAALHNKVLADIERPIHVSGRDRVTTLVGMVGAGKSVLAAAFARASETRQSFSSDGVVWIQVGQTPPPSYIPQVIGTAFGVDLGPDPVLARARLSDALKRRACLIVLDDVWEVSDAEIVVNALDERGRLLITTRDRNVASAFGNAIYEVAELDKDGALRLLAAYAQLQSASLLPEAAEVAEHCHNLPFALALCGTMIAEGSTWSDLVDRLKAADLGYIEAALPNYPYKDLLRAQEVSTAHLPPALTERYCDLVVFPRNRGIPENAIFRLWSASGAPDFESRKMLVTFYRRNLIRLDGTAPTRTVSMHDLQHDYLTAVVKDARARHLRLMEAYREQTVDGLWHTLPGDGYIHSHLIWHMEAAGRLDDIDFLLKEQASDGRNGWYEALSRRGELATYVADVRRAWGIAKRANRDAIEVGGTADHLDAEIRYALSLSSTYNRAARIPRPLLALCLKYGVLDRKQVSSVAEMHIEPGARARAWATIATAAPADLRGQALKAAVDAAYLIDAEGSRLKVLSCIARAPGLPEDLVEKILTASSVDRGVAGAGVLSALAPRLSGRLLDDAVRVAKAIDPSLARLRALSLLVQRLPGKRRVQELPEMITDVEAMEPELEKVQAFCALAPLWPEASERALIVAEEILREEASFASNGWVFVALSQLQSLSPSQWERITRALQTAELNNDSRALAMCALGHHLSEAQRSSIVRRYVTTLRSSARSFLAQRDLEALLAFYLPEDERAEAIANNIRTLVFTAGASYSPFSLGEKWHKHQALSSLSDLPEPLLATALEYAKQIADDEGRAEVLEKLLPRCSDGGKAAVLEAELWRLERTSDGAARARVATALVVYLKDPLRSQVAQQTLASIQAINVSSEDSFSLTSALLPYLGKMRLQVVLEALDRAMAIPDRCSKDRALARLATHVPQPSVASVLREAERLTMEGDGNYQTLAALVHRLSEIQRQAAIAKILAAAKNIAGELPGDFVNALQAIRPYLNAENITSSLAIAESVSKIHRSAAWALLAPLVPMDNLRDIHRRAQSLESEHRAQALCSICPYLPEGERAGALAEALAAVDAQDDLHTRIGALRELTSHLEPSTLSHAASRAFADAMALSDDRERSTTLCALIRSGALSVRQRLVAFQEMLESSLGVTVTAQIGASKVRANLPRSFLLDRIADAPDAVLQIGGKAQAIGVVNVIREIGTWWP